MDKEKKVSVNTIPYNAVTKDGLFQLEPGYFAYTFFLNGGNAEQTIWAAGLRDTQFSSYNINGSVYHTLTVRIEANTPSEAKGQIAEIQSNLKNATATTLGQQLSLIGALYHNLATINKKMESTTKELVGSKEFTVDPDYVKMDNGYVRTYAVNYFSDVNEKFASLLTNPPKGCVVTAHCHPINPYTVIEDIKEQYGENVYPNSEEVKIKEAVIPVLDKAAANNEPVYEADILVGLFDSDIDNIKHISNDFCRFVSLDYVQDKAFKSLLPLARTFVDVKKVYSLHSIASLLPGFASPGKYAEAKKENNFFAVNAKAVHQKGAKKKSTVQETIPYYAAYLEDGIFENSPGVFSKAYKFSDINYHTATEEDQITFLERYAQLLNRIDSSLHCQILIVNKNVDMKEFRENNTLKIKGDGLDVYRKEYNAMILSKIQEGRNSLKKERYFLLSADAENYPAAKRVFSRFDPEIRAAFKDIGGVVASPLNTTERLELLFDMYNPGNEGTFRKNFDIDTFSSMGLTTKDVVAPSCFDFKRDYFRMGDKFCRVLYLIDLPNSLSDKFMSELTATSCNMAVSINLECMRQDKAVNFTKRQLTNINVVVQKAQQTASKNGYSMDLVPAEVTQAQREANELLSGLTSANQKMFIMTFTVLVYGDTLEELNVNTETIKTTGRKFLCNIKPLTMQQEMGLAATLPLCNNKLPVKRTLTTNSTVIFVPFDVQELNEPHGIYYGQNASSRNLILYNRKDAQNSNGWILGTTGSGKSFSAKREITSVMLNTDDDVLIIDPEREYSPLAQAFGGSVVRIAPGSKWHLNPLDLDPDYADGDDPIVLKSDFIISLCETAVGGRYGLEPIQNSIIDRCVRLVYKDFIGKYDMNPEYTPTLLDFQKVLESQPEMAAKELAISLEIYTKGALDVFAHKSNVDINNRFVVYDIKDIGSSALNTLAYLVVLDNIWDRVIKNRRLGKRTWVYMDEIYVLFEHEQSTNFIRQIFSRGRKYGSIMTALTQNVSTILSNVVATTMLSNSAFVQLLNQAPADKNLLVDLLTISPQQANFITDARQGHGLLYVQNVGIVPFEDDFPKDICPELYKVMTSKPDELMEEFR